jgi:hypothetical protein
MYRIVLSSLVFAILLVLGVGLPLYAQPGVCTPVIKNFPGEAFLIGFGEPGAAYVAQTFTALPGGATDLAIELAGRSGPDDVDFHVLIAEVSGSGLNFHPTTVLFESDTITFNSSAPLTVIHIPLPNLALVPGNTYAFILDAFVTRDGFDGMADVATNGTYGDGACYFKNALTGGSRADHFADQWSFPESMYPPEHHDIAFQLTFGPTDLCSDEYFPLSPGAIWKYLKNGKQTVVRKVLSKQVKVRGVDTSPLEYVDENVTEYVTNDSNGIFLHREYAPGIYIDGVGRVDIDTTFIPPIKIADGALWIGASYHSSGTARSTVWPMGVRMNFEYAADSAIESVEDVTVPAGTFQAIKTSQNITMSGETLSGVRCLVKGIGVVKDVSTNTQGRTATFELVSMTSLALLTPNGGEEIGSGGTYDIMWNATPGMTAFRLAYSLDNGVTWKAIRGAENVAENHYLWTVPSPMANKKTCLVRVTGYNTNDDKVKTDISDAPFTIEVASITAPIKDAIVSKGTLAYPVTWITNGISQDVSAEIFYTLDKSGIWKKAAGRVVDPLTSFGWDVPSPAEPKNAKLKVVFKDASGTKVATAISSLFRIE